MKYIYTTTLLFLFTLASLSAQQGPLVVDLKHTLDENSGGVFDVEIRVSDFVDLFTFQLFMKWDPDMYRIDGVPYVNDELPFFDDTSIILPAEDVSIPDDGKVRIIWSNATTLTLNDDTHIVTLRFTALGQPCEESKFFFDDIGTLESETLLAADANFEDVGIQFDDMNVQIPGVDCVSSNENLLDDISINIFPNPVMNILNVDLSNHTLDAVQFTLYTIEGKKVNEYTLNKTNSNISVTELENGSFLYDIRSSKGIIQRGTLYKI